MSGSLDLSGSITVSGSGGDCGPCAGAGDTLVKSLGGECAASYQTVVATAKPLSVSTADGTFVDLDLLDGLTRIEFLFVRSSSAITLRIGAAAASLVGSGGTFPTGFAGGETLDLSIDGTAFTVTFDAADQSAAQVAARINAAAALAGLATPRAVVQASGQLAISGVDTGSDASVAVTGGTGAATVGFAGTPSASGAGADVLVTGTFMCEFSRTSAAPARVQVSGVASLSVVAGGRSDGL